MSVGKPVIVTTAVGSAPDVVQHGVNGYIVPEKDADSLYNALKNIIMNKDARERMGITSKKIIEKAYTYEHAVKGLDRAIRAVICSRAD